MMALMDRLPEELLARLDYDFVGVSSYQGTENTGQIELTKDLVVAVAGRDVLVVDGIVDTGRSLDFVLDHDRVAATPVAQSMYVAQQTCPQGVSSADRVLWF